MTPTERRLCDAIERLTVNGVSPSYDELAQALGLASKSGINRMVTALVAQGAVTSTPAVARSLRVVPVLDVEVKRLIEANGVAAVLRAIRPHCRVHAGDYVRQAMNAVEVDDVYRAMGDHR